MGLKISGSWGMLDILLEFGICKTMWSTNWALETQTQILVSKKKIPTHWYPINLTNANHELEKEIEKMSVGCQREQTGREFEKKPKMRPAGKTAHHRKNARYLLNAFFDPWICRVKSWCLEYLFGNQLWSHQSDWLTLVPEGVIKPECGLHRQPPQLSSSQTF